MEKRNKTSGGVVSFWSYVLPESARLEYPAYSTRCHWPVFPLALGSTRKTRLGDPPEAGADTAGQGQPRGVNGACSEKPAKADVSDPCAGTRHGGTPRLRGSPPVLTDPLPPSL